VSAEPNDSSRDISLELVERIQSGDGSAWEDFYVRYHDPLLFAIRCRLGANLRSRLQSEDVLHSVVADAFRDLGRFEPRGPGSLSHYLHVCVLNKIRSKAEFHAALKRSGDVPLSSSLADRLPTRGDAQLDYVDAARYERLERALAALPEDMREAVLLRTVEGLSNQEAAAALGKSEEATSKLYSRALARLGTLAGKVSRDP
jgi:RNA polymerase sigma-70 factor (ECF subfamily)